MIVSGMITAVADPNAAHRPDPAEALFAKTYKEFLNNWAIIGSLRELAELGVPLVEDALARRYARVAHTFTHDSEYDRIFLEKEKFLRNGGEEWLRDGMKNLSLRNARTSIDAATLVFAHSILDASAFSYCTVTALARPSDWEEFVRQKKVDIAETKAKSYAEILQEAVETRLEHLEMESLDEKVRMLHAVCKPPKDFEPLNDYKFERDRLQKIDAERNGIVHGLALGIKLPKIEDDLEWIGKTVNYFMALVNQHTGVQLNPAAMFNLHKPPADSGF